MSRDPGSPPAAAPAASTTVDEERTCIRCGYQLQGLSRRGFCPECGAPVERSMGASLLQFADPAWVTRLCGGVRLMVASVMIKLAGIVLLIVMIQHPWGPVGGIKLARLITIAAMVLGVFSLWLITSPDPAAKREESPLSLRNIVLACAMAACAGQSAQMLDAAFGGGLPFKVAAHAASLCGLVAIGGELTFLRRYAERLPDEALATLTRNVMYGLIACMGLYQVLDAVQDALSPIARNSPAVALSCAVALLGLAIVVYYVRYVSLLFKYLGALSIASAVTSAMPIAARARRAHQDDA